MEEAGRREHKPRPLNKVPLSGRGLHSAGRAAGADGTVGERDLRRVRRHGPAPPLLPRPALCNGAARGQGPGAGLREEPRAAGKEVKADRGRWGPGRSPHARLGVPHGPPLWGKSPPSPYRRVVLGLFSWCDLKCLFFLCECYIFIT